MRKSTGSRPKCSPRPPQTPASMRWRRLRRSGPRSVGSPSAAAGWSPDGVSSSLMDPSSGRRGDWSIGEHPESTPRGATGGSGALRIVAATGGRDHRVVARARTVHRSRRRRMVAGVAAGLADWLGVDPIVVRIAFVVLTLSSGIGIVLYGLCWLAIPEEGKDSVDLPRFLIAHRGRSVRDVRRLGALGLVLLGGLLFLRDSGLWVGDRVVWPAVLAAIGLVVIWRQVEGARWKTRAGLGILFVAGGVGLFLAANVNLTSVRQGVLATAAIVAGLLLIFGPWWLRLTRDLMDERRQRIRSDERADVATRVHDSVLQTLALIQRNSSDPREVVRLARHQERELRSWLFPDSAAAPPGTLKGARDAVGAEVEDLHGVPVEVIAVGDCPVDNGLDALVLATREAVV